MLQDPSLPPPHWQAEVSSSTDVSAEPHSPVIIPLFTTQSAVSACYLWTLLVAHIHHSHTTNISVYHQNFHLKLNPLKRNIYQDLVLDVDVCVLVPKQFLILPTGHNETHDFNSHWPSSRGFPVLPAIWQVGPPWKKSSASNIHKATSDKAARGGFAPGHSRWPCLSPRPFYEQKPVEARFFN